MHVIINGVSSETLQGVQVLSLPPITKPRMRTSVAVIDGRPGDIVTRLGYEAYNRKIQILLHHDYDIDAISAFFNTSGTIIFSNEPDMEYEFETIDAFSFERAVRYKTADITFHVQPYKLSATEEPATGEVSTLVDKTPYIIRRTPFGARQKGTIIGGSVVWNQLCNNASVTVANGHKYLLEKDDAYSIGASTGTALTGLTAGSDMVFDLTILFGPTIADYIYAQEQATAGAGVALAKAWAGIVNDYYPYDEGSIKSVEGLTAHKMTGFNQWDEEWEVGGLNASGAVTGQTDRIRSKNLIPVIAGQTYYFKGSYYLWAYDSNGVFINRLSYNGIGGTAGVVDRTVLIPSGVANIKFVVYTSYGTTYNHDICINLSDPSRNGVYEPYTAHTYPLDSSLTLRGLPKLDGDSIYYDGDVYKADGTVERRYGVVDLGTLNWSKDNQTNNPGRFYSSGLASVIRKPTASAEYGAFILCTKYIAGENPISTPKDADKMVAVYTNGTVYISDIAYTDNTAAEFKTAMSGVYLVYALAEPTTEQADPYTELQICDPSGTEEWVGASMPVGHETTYIDPISMTMTNEGNTESAPSITIEGEGAVEVTVDGLNILQIQMPASGEITIDSKTLDATDGEGGLANRSVTGDYNDLRLTPGEHTVTVAGDVTSVTIKNASRWI